MRKILLSLLLVLLMAVGVTTAQPVPATDLSDLARYYEDDTLVFASIRTDEAFFQEIDTLADRVIGFLPESDRPEMGLLDSLNQELQAETGQTLDEAIFPWLGDTAALGIPLLMAENLDQTDAPFYAAFDIDDPAAARAYMESVIDDATITEQNGYTLIEGVDGGLMAIGTDVLFLSSMEYSDMLPLSGVASPLSESASFTDTMSQLPADGYNAVAYINTAQLQQTIFTLAEEEGQSVPGLLTQLSSATLGQAFGATIQGDSALTLDVVQVIDTAIYDEFGIEPYRPGAVDLNFAARIPADAPLVIHGADFGPSLQASLDMLRSFGDYLQENETLADLTESGQDVPLSPTERALLNNVDPAWLLGAFNSTFAGFTGVSFERDVLTTLDSDAALYLRVIPSEGVPFLPVAPDFAALFQTSDPAAGADFVQSLVDAFAAYDLDYATESYGDGQAIVIDELTRQMGSEPIPQLDFLIAGSDNVFALGTRRAVEAALDTSGGLAATEAFSTASQSLLPEPTNVWYLGTGPLFALLDTLLQQGIVTPNDLDSNTRTFLRLASIIESATVSTQSPAEGIGVSRAVLNFGTEPYIAPAGGQAALPGTSN